MASYTMQLREYVEHFSQDEENLSHKERIEKGRERLFDFNYPIFDEKYKAVFETNFIRNFYMREIGFESEGLFKFQLETWLLINMPYYNRLFESELIKFNPLESYSLKTTYKKKNDTTQDETRNRLQNDDKLINQNDTSKNQLNETEMGSQNDLRSVNQNDRNTKNQNENRDITQNDQTTLKHDSNTQTDTLNSNTEVTQNESTVDTESLTENNGERETIGKTKDIVDNFNRTLETDTPDTRLQMTLNDGEGALEYASRITENNQNNEKESTSENKETQKDTSDVTSNVTTKGDGTVTNEGDSHLDTTVKSDDVGSLSSKVADKLIADTTDVLISTVDDETTRRNTNQKNHVIDGSLNSEINDRLNSEINDKATNVINNLEDYVEDRVGSIGVKTYSEMIMEYRESLIRIEKQIFKEMNELFMLVY